MSNEELSYKAAGVDIDAGNRFVNMIKPLVKSTMRPEVKTDIGGFGGLFGFNSDKYKKPVLVSGTDGVGTKLKLAFLADKHDTVGIDLVAMCVNDIIVQGAEPLFFLDYLATGSLSPEKMAEVVKGIADGCRQAGCALIGGETAEMPGMYGSGEYDLAGFTVGVVDESNIIDGSTVTATDTIIGLPSSGLHSNGFSLARKVFLEKMNLSLDAELEGLDKTLGETLLEPTRIYVKALLSTIEKVTLKSLSHITGGGLLENVPRSLPDNVTAKFFTDSWKMPAIFTLLEKGGNINREEMYRTFNCGIGMTVIVAKEDTEQALAALTEAGEQPVIIGEIIDRVGDGPQTIFS